MSASDIINLLSAATSIVLAVVALWLSVVFYRMSSNEAQRSQRSAEEISSNVQRLEALFNSMYSDTFSMMRETVTDMRAHVWKAQDEDKNGPSVNEQERVLIDSLIENIAEVSNRLGVTEGRLQELRTEVQPAVKSAIERSQNITVTTRGSRSDLMDRIRYTLDRNGPMTVDELFSRPLIRGHYDFDDVAKAIYNFRKNGILESTGPENSVTGDMVVSLTRRRSK
jgi:hypothetical protein